MVTADVAATRTLSRLSFSEIGSELQLRIFPSGEIFDCVKRFIFGDVQEDWLEERLNKPLF
jgi:hypothetical protein